MTYENSQSLTDLIGAIEQQIAVAQGHSLTDAAFLLEMAKLDIRMRLHAISNSELRAFSEALEAERTVSRRNGHARSAPESTFTPLSAMASISVMTGVPDGAPRSLQTRAATLFRAQDRRNPRSRRRAAALRADR
jgi:hypothetical protein